VAAKSHATARIENLLRLLGELAEAVLIVAKPLRAPQRWSTS
jgi:hypothetical protein